MQRGGSITEPVLVFPRHLTSHLYPPLAEALLVPRRWHLDGRYGSRTHAIADECDGGTTTKEYPGVPRMGFPVLESAVPVIESWLCECRQHNRDHVYDKSVLPEWKYLLALNASCVTLALDRPRVTAKVIPDPSAIDATVHPERAPIIFFTASSYSKPSASFTFVELFAGIGGFAMGLEPLGGKCVFASEINTACHVIYEANVDLSSHCLYGDISSIPADLVPEHDLLVGGFPCQPFSSLGEQRGLEDYTASAGNRGMLFTHIVRILKAKRPSAFLLENVPGLIETDGGRALSTIRTALECEGGYDVAVEVVSSRGLTAQSRKRLFFVGLRRPMSKVNNNAQSKSPVFEFPYIPDLGLRAVDVLDDDDEVASYYGVTDDQFLMLRTRKKSKWKPAKLAWPDTVCDTLDGHYGRSVGRGSSQLVPRVAPLTPRKFTLRECCRLMGFSSHCFQIPDPKTGNEAKALYQMLGNAVCPPVVAAIAGSILDHILPQVGSTFDGKGSVVDGNINACSGYWVHHGVIVATRLALDAIRPDRRDIVSEKIKSELGEMFII